MTELPLTEQPNPQSSLLDCLSIEELITLMRQEDQRMLAAFDSIQETLAAVIRTTVTCLQQGGRLIYMGAGTSGRLGVLDAVECPPTFRTPPGQVIALIAGGRQALETAVEGAEDNEMAAIQDLMKLAPNAKDMVIGIAASGSTPYVRAGLRQAHACGAHTTLIACTDLPTNDQSIEYYLLLKTGPEILTGSTRLKAGTATKLVLNMISTITMVQLGKVYGNYMVDLHISNQKLQQRALRILKELTNLSETEAWQLLQNANGEVKTALLMHLGRLDAEQARKKLAQHQGYLRAALRDSHLL